jgi:hypothetical protein
MQDAFTGAIVEPDEATSLPVARLLERFPVALLVPASDQPPAIGPGS